MRHFNERFGEVMEGGEGKEEKMGAREVVADVGGSDSGRVVLLYHPFNTVSHRMQQTALLEGLLGRGHKVIGVFPQVGRLAWAGALGQGLARDGQTSRQSSRWLELSPQAGQTDHPGYTEIVLQDRSPGHQSTRAI